MAAACGRNVVSVRHDERPVPLMKRIWMPADRTENHPWPLATLHARAWQPNWDLPLIFAPRRKSAEAARTLASALPGQSAGTEPEQQAVADPALARCLKNRIAFHHSGMSYAQRAGLVEPLAKHNQLKVIVATTGLAAGINFPCAQVLVLEQEYRIADGHRQLRPDELLQMLDVRAAVNG